MRWRGIVGKSFTSAAAFADYVETVQFNLWRPKFVVVHNTSAPDLATYEKWQARGSPSDEQWMKNLEGFYRDQQEWSAGPHLFVTPRSICAFTPLNVPGTHTPSWNSISWGVETVGEFEHEPFDGSIRGNLIAALGVLHRAAGLRPDNYVLGRSGLHFHKEDIRTSHKTCPGHNMNKAKLVGDVSQWMRDHQDSGEHTTAPVVA